MRILDLFSGIGGFSLAAQWAGIETVGFCEIEPFCQKVLKKNFPNVPIYSDIRKLKREDIDGTVDIISGGFPCQPFSIAGRKKGTQDNRDLWPEMLRVIKEFKPTWVIGENVANFLNMAFTRTKTDLEVEGYEVQPFIIPACGVGAPHRRDRVWIVAHSDNNECKQSITRVNEKKEGIQDEVRPKDCNTGLSGRASTVREACDRYNVADTERKRQTASKHEGRPRHQEGVSQGCSETLADTESIDWNDDETITRNGKSSTQEIPRDRSSVSGESTGWHVEPNVGRVAHGVPARVDRLKGLGNAIVPQVAYQILKGIGGEK